MLGLNGSVNVSRLSIQSPDWSNVAISVKIVNFLHAELQLQRCQLTLALPCRLQLQNDKFFLSKFLQFIRSFLSSSLCFICRVLFLFLIAFYVGGLRGFGGLRGILCGVLRGIGALRGFLRGFLRSSASFLKISFSTKTILSSSPSFSIFERLCSSILGGLRGSLRGGLRGFLGFLWRLFNLPESLRTLRTGSLAFYTF